MRKKAKRKFVSKVRLRNGLRLSIEQIKKIAPELIGWFGRKKDLRVRIGRHILNSNGRVDRVGKPIQYR